MSRNYKIRDQEKLYFISFAVVNWIDVFIRPIYKDIIVDSLKFCIEKKGLEVYGWCIMTSHIHLIIGTESDKMEDIIRDLKKHTSKEILKEIKDNPQESRKEWMLWMFERAGRKNSNNKTYQFWQQHNHPIELSDNYTMQQKLDYLHANPVVTVFVSEPQEYVYSSAIDYSGGKGLVPVKILE
ncbi:MAG: transposase [Fulvivirga sp.]|uniref:REP-associated tyrosine transposase n=1 Tax=Fulvivirga sp. TaxID=1931237 RepID=UPI0032F8E376